MGKLEANTEHFFTEVRSIEEISHWNFSCVFLISQCASGLRMGNATFSWQASGSHLRGWANQAREYMNMQIFNPPCYEGSYLFRSIALDLGFAGSFFFRFFVKTPLFLPLVCNQTHWNNKYLPHWRKASTFSLWKCKKKVMYKSTKHTVTCHCGWTE